MLWSSVGTGLWDSSHHDSVMFQGEQGGRWRLLEKAGIVCSKQRQPAMSRGNQRFSRGAIPHL